MRGELESKRQLKDIALEHKEKLESDVLSMQEKKELEDSLHKELHLLNASFRETKKTTLQRLSTTVTEDRHTNVELTVIEDGSIKTDDAEEEEDVSADDED